MNQILFATCRMMDGTIQSGFADEQNIQSYREGKSPNVRTFWFTTGKFHAAKSAPVTRGKPARMD